MNSTISILVVDDEPLARDLVRSYLAGNPKTEIIGECATGIEAVNAIIKYNPDLVFLDIQMPDLNGFQVLAELDVEKRPLFIFITAFDSYAVKAFDENAVDYLLKPFLKERFDVAIEKALTAIANQSFAQMDKTLSSLVESYTKYKLYEPKEDFPDRLLIKESKVIFFIKILDIDWIEASGDYVKLHCGKKTHLLNDSLTNFENKLDPAIFYRIHRSTIVNVNFIKEFHPYFNGEYTIVLTDGTHVKLSRSYKDRVKELFGHHLI